MKNKLWLTDRYIRYLLTAKSRYHIHSPFLYKLIDDVFRDRSTTDQMLAVEKTRELLLRDRSIIHKTDYGTGAEAAGNTVYKVEVREVARKSLSAASKARLLFRLVKYFKPKTVLELGTSFGLSTSYMAMAVPGTKVISIEGCPVTAELARKHILGSGIGNVEVVTGEFASILPELLRSLNSVDFMFLDGNHRKEATLSYFELCKKKAVNDTVFVFDDIHWSKGMEEAWRTIKSDPDVRLTVDIFHLGLVFFRKESTPEHFIIRY